MNHDVVPLCGLVLILLGIIILSNKKVIHDSLSTKLFHLDFSPSNFLFIVWAFCFHSFNIGPMSSGMSQIRKSYPREQMT